VQISSSSYFFVNLSDVTSTLITNQWCNIFFAVQISSSSQGVHLL
jgi:hypothetical protein